MNSSEDMTSKTLLLFVFSVFLTMFSMSWLSWVIANGQLYPSQLRTLFSLTKQLFHL